MCRTPIDANGSQRVNNAIFTIEELARFTYAPLAIIVWKFNSRHSRILVDLVDLISPTNENDRNVAATPGRKWPRFPRFSDEEQQRERERERDSSLTRDVFTLNSPRERTKKPRNQPGTMDQRGEIGSSRPLRFNWRDLRRDKGAFLFDEKKRERLRTFPARPVSFAVAESPKVRYIEICLAWKWISCLFLLDCSFETGWLPTI